MSEPTTPKTEMPKTDTLQPDTSRAIRRSAALPASRIARHKETAKEASNGASNRAQAEMASRRFQSLIENALDIITVVDAEGVIRYQSPAVEPTLGYGREDLNGKPYRAYVHPDDLPYMAAALGELLQHPGVTLSMECRFRHADGSWRLLESRGCNLLREPSVAGIVINSRDTTLSRQAEAARRHSENQLRLITDAAPVLISYVDAQQVYRFNNRAYAEWMGRPSEEITGKHLAETLGPVAYAQARADIETALSGQEVTYEREMRYHGVEPRYVHATMVPDIAPSGEVKGLVGVVTDITAHKRAEAALRASEQQYRYLAEAIPQIVWTADADGTRDYYNQRWMEYTGLTLEQTLAGGEREILHPDDLETTREVWARALQTGAEYQREQRLRGRDGAYRWFLTRATPMRDANGNIQKWFGTATDIDAQKRAQERERLLGELGERMRATLVPQDVMWAAVEVVGEHLQVSRCYYTDTDTDADKVVIHRDYCRNVASWTGTYRLSSFGAGVQADLNVGKTAAIADTQTDPRTAQHYETTYALTDIRAYLAVPLMEGGKRVASLVVSMAGHPRVWTPEEVTLLETVAARTRLAVENARLWQAERERSAQLARAIQEVHHRVKNSLQGVSALLEMQLPLEGDMMPVETVRGGLNQIKVIALVHDLLAQDKPIGKVNAGAVLTNLAQLMSAGMQTPLCPSPVRVRTEAAWIPTKAATALALVVQELIANAAKHSRNYKVGTARKGPAIEVCLTRREEQIVVVVEDNGPGFPPDFNPSRSANIGMELVLTLVRHDLSGNVTFTNRADHAPNAQGGRVEIVFSEADLAE